MEMKMKMSKLILVSVTVVLVWCLGAGEGFTYDDREVETLEAKKAMFERWRSHHNMEAISEKEKMKQFEVFQANLEIVHATNKANKPYKLEMNRFAGMTKAEFKAKHTGLKGGGPKIRPGKKFVSNADWPVHFKYRNVTNVPPSIDWRALGAVTPVKNQGDCGSCYAFGVADTIEGIQAVQNKELIELSTKQILDCCNCGGCDGAQMKRVFQYVIDCGGLTKAENYPYDTYKAIVETCNVQKEKEVAVKIKGYEQVPFNSEDALMATLAHQPVEVSVESAGDIFFLYQSGVLTGTCGTNVDHSVVAVGYDTDPDGTKYWLLKNSWGDYWGEKGYIRILRGSSEPKGHCGIAMDGIYPTLEDCGQDHMPGGDPLVHMSREL